MLYIRSLTFAALGFAACTAPTAIHAERISNKNTVVVVQGYNVIFTNNYKQIFAQALKSLKGNSDLLKLILKPAFVKAIYTKLRLGTPITGFYPIFDQHDQTGRLKNIANDLLVKGKREVTEGIETIKTLIKHGYRVIVVIGSEEIHQNAYFEMFPILRDAGIEVIFNFQSSKQDTFTKIKELVPSPNYIFVHGKNHPSVKTATDVGYLPSHYNDVLRICHIK